MAFAQDRWQHLCDGLGCPSASSRFDDIRAAYGQRHRHYHTAQHIAECLAVFDESGRPAKKPFEVEFAIWLHDIVYRPRRSDNESASAELATQWLDVGGARAETVDRVARLIEVTKHDAEPESPDEALLLDVDLNVLGTPAERYEEYEAQVRREYRWVPGPLFRRRRAELLEAFLNRDPLYNTPWFRSRFEDQAKRNLRRAIANLTGRAV